MERFDGHIMGAAFASGHRLVAGRWSVSPLGSFTDLMWRRPDGRRILISSSEAAIEFICRHYRFDEARLTPVDIVRTGHRIDVSAEDLRLRLELKSRGVAGLLLRLQPKGLRTIPGWIEFQERFGRPLLGPWLFGGGRTRLTGSTQAGTREWYAIHDFLPADASGASDGHDLGRPGACPVAGFGFSEFPDGAALVRVSSLFEAEK